MSASHSSHSSLSDLTPPGPARISSQLRGVFGLLVLVGIASFVLTLFKDPESAWSSFLIGHFYFLSLALGGVFFAVIQWVTGAMWSAPVRRLFESFAAYLPIALITTVILCLGLGVLYHWTHAEVVQGDIILEGKEGYLNIPFFIIRNVGALLVLGFLAWKLIGHSIAQDTDKNYAHTLANRRLGPVFLVLFALLYSFSAVDQLMSLDPHWFSTMFGVYAFAGLFYSMLAMTCLLTLAFKERQLKDFINDNHIHDIGKFMFAFTVFWAYIGFSQFMLIWYANLPEETGYFIRRMSGGWWYVSLFLLIGKFMVPFFALLPRGAKRNPTRLKAVAIWMLFAQLVDLVWVVQPELYSEGPNLTIMGLVSLLGTFAGFAGLFGLAVAWFLGKFSLVAMGDPRLEESVFHHHQ